MSIFNTALDHARRLPAPWRAKIRSAVESAGAFGNLFRRRLTPFQLKKYDKLHLGAGAHHIPGWANIDFSGRKNLIWDLTRPLPLAAGKIKRLYSEHFIEHISRENCLHLFRHIRESMAPDGILRIATPDLKLFAQCYLQREVPPDWEEQNPCRAFNEVMRNWGHTFLYDEEELTEILTQAGFRSVRRVVHRISEDPDLHNIERRGSQLDLIMEARP